MSAPLRVTAGRLAYRVAYLVLRAWSALARPRTRGVKCLVVHGGEILLVRHSYGAKVWELPGGFCRRGESFADAARREMAEELGLPADTTFAEIGVLRRHMQGRRETLWGFRVEPAARDVTVERVEIVRCGWFAADALPPDTAPIVAELLELQGGFAGPAPG